ncbi:hypothetical protein ACQY0O_005407 [Thecaphora frezii]
MAKASSSKLSQPVPKRRQAKRTRLLSPSSSDDVHVNSDGDGEAQRLAQLRAYGNAFLASFGIDSSEAIPPAAAEERASSSQPKSKTSSRGKQKAKEAEREVEGRNDIDRVFYGSEPEEEAWGGIADSDDDSSQGSVHAEDESDRFEGHSGVSDEEEIDGSGSGSCGAIAQPSPPRATKHEKNKAKARLLKGASALPKPTPPRLRPVETVVFGGDASATSSPLDPSSSKRGWKAFMSSKISKISEEPSDTPEPKTRRSKAEQDEEKQLESNDRLLSHLLSTTLFAPGAEREGKKRNLSSNDTLARILELSATETQRKGVALGRGWGEMELQRRQLAKMPAKIRQDVRRANAERRDQEREKAKELGTWHPSLKANYSNKATATEMGVKAEPKKRLRGIGAGIGKFKDGTLSLSKSDVRKINGPSGSDRGDSKNKKRRKK